MTGILRRTTIVAAAGITGWAVGGTVALYARGFAGIVAFKLPLVGGSEGSGEWLEAAIFGVVFGAVRGLCDGFSVYHNGKSRAAMLIAALTGSVSCATWVGVSGYAPPGRLVVSAGVGIAVAESVAVGLRTGRAAGGWLLSSFFGMMAGLLLGHVVSPGFARLPYEMFGAVQQFFIGACEGVSRGLYWGLRKGPRPSS